MVKFISSSFLTACLIICSALHLRRGKAGCFWSRPYTITYKKGARVCYCIVNDSHVFYPKNKRLPGRDSLLNICLKINIMQLPTSLLVRQSIFLHLPGRHIWQNSLRTSQPVQLLFCRMLPYLPRYCVVSVFQMAR